MYGNFENLSNYSLLIMVSYCLIQCVSRLYEIIFVGINMVLGGVYYLGLIEFYIGLCFICYDFILFYVDG